MTDNPNPLAGLKPDELLQELRCSVTVELMEHASNVQAEIRRRLLKLEACEKAATELLDAMDTCHICQVKVHVGEEPMRCENCSGDCEEHEGPDCKPLSLLHQNLRAALKERP